MTDSTDDFEYKAAIAEHNLKTQKQMTQFPDMAPKPTQEPPITSTGTHTTPVPSKYVDETQIRIRVGQAFNLAQTHYFHVLKTAGGKDGNFVEKQDTPKFKETLMKTVEWYYNLLANEGTALIAKKISEAKSANK